MTRLYVLICGLLLFGCSSQREIHHESSARIGVVDTSSLDRASVSKSGKWWSLYAFCDSLHIRLWADSAVTPEGSVIHNPNIDLSAQRPVVSCEGGEISAEEDSVRMESELALSGESSGTVDDQQEAKTAGGSGGLLWIGMAMILLLSAVYYYRFCRNCINNKS